MLCVFVVVDVVVVVCLFVCFFVFLFFDDVFLILITNQKSYLVNI